MKGYFYNEFCMLCGKPHFAYWQQFLCENEHGKKQLLEACFSLPARAGTQDDICTKSAYQFPELKSEEVYKRIIMDIMLSPEVIKQLDSLFETVTKQNFTKEQIENVLNQMKVYGETGLKYAEYLKYKFRERDGK
jgi:hypothetical protein